MKGLLATIALLILCVAASPAQSVVWNWVPNPHAGNDIFPNLIGDLLFINPSGGFSTMPIDINGDGSVDFEFRVYNSGYSDVEVLQRGSNEVLAVLEPPGEIGETAVALYRSNVVSSLPPTAPTGAEWLREIIIDPYEVAAMLGGEFSAENQYTDKRAFVGVRFYGADGLHYGALQVIAAGGNPVIGIIFGYGYNPTPDAPFDLSEVPPDPVSFSAHVSGANEVPTNRSTNSGWGDFSLVSYVGASNALLYHLDLNASFQPTGAGLFGPATPGSVSHRSIADLTNSFQDGQVSLSSNQVSQLMRGQLYVNLMSARFPRGELRGQILSATNAQLSAILRDCYATPRYNNGDRGQARLQLIGASVAYYIALDTNTVWKSAGIYNSPFPESADRNLVARLDLSNSYELPSPFFPDAPGRPGQRLYVGVVTLTDLQVARLKRGSFYLRIGNSYPLPRSEIGGRILATGSQ